MGFDPSLTGGQLWPNRFEITDLESLRARIETGRRHHGHPRSRPALGRPHSGLPAPGSPTSHRSQARVLLDFGLPDRPEHPRSPKVPPMSLVAADWCYARLIGPRGSKQGGDPMAEPVPRDVEASGRAAGLRGQGDSGAAAPRGARRHGHERRRVARGTSTGQRSTSSPAAASRSWLPPSAMPPPPKDARGRLPARPRDPPEERDYSAAVRRSQELP